MKKLYMVILTLCMILMMNYSYIYAESESSVTDITSIEEIKGSGSYRLIVDSILSKDLTLEAGWDVTIDLNGNTIKSSGKILNQGTLHMVDYTNNGKYITSGTIAVRNNGNMYVNGGTFQTLNIGGAVLLNGQTGYLQIDNINVEARSYGVYNKGGKAVINNGKFNSTSNYSESFLGYTIANKDLDTAELIINYAEVTGIQGAVANAIGSVTIYDGNFSTKKDDLKSFYAYYVAGEDGLSKGNIYGGTFYSPKHAVYVGNDNTGGDGGINADATTTIYGGSFTGDKGAVYYAPNTAKNPNIIAGLFSSDVSKYLSSTSLQIEEGNAYRVGKKATNLELNTSTLRLELGKNYQAFASITPSDTLESLKWASSNPRVASVDQNGNITSHKIGNTTISATIGNLTKSIAVSVYEYQIVIPPVESSKPSEGITIGVNDANVGSVLKDTLGKITNDTTGIYINSDVSKKLQAALDSGKKIAVNIGSVPVSVDMIEKEEINVFQNAIGKITGETQSSNIAQFMDISVMLQAGDESLGEIHRLSDEITFTIQIPEETLKEGQEYVVFRLHDGVVTQLPAKLTGNKLTFSTDQFSLYAVGIIESKEILEPAKPAKPAKPAESSDDINKGVETGDTTRILSGSYIMIGSMSVMVVAYYKKRKIVGSR